MAPLVNITDGPTEDEAFKITSLVASTGRSRRGVPTSSDADTRRDDRVAERDNVGLGGDAAGEG
jgi:hypothetical protein